ncbi:MAG: elongation factor [Frankiales bacterium]|nr:elongation factor [Frankiales bacterium]
MSALTKAAIRTKAPSVGKAAGRGPYARAALPTEQPSAVRNIAIIGHSGVGKTTLVEHLLSYAGMINRLGSIAEGTTVSDSDPVEVSQQRSVVLSACSLTWKGVLVNLLDTPGFGDFVGELRAGLRAADAVVFLVSAVDPLDETTLALWQECAALDLPRAVVINRLEMPQADFDTTLEAARGEYGLLAGNAVVALAEPAADNSAVVGLLEGNGERSAALIEAIIAESEDETLLENYLDGAELDRSRLLADLHTAVGRGHLHPVLPVCTVSEVGLAELLDLIVDGLPSPAERPLPPAWTPVGGARPPLACDPEGPLAAEVVRTWADPYVGRVSLVRVFSGTLSADCPLHVTGRGAEERGHPDHDADEKPATLLSTSLVPLERVVAGNICLLSRLGSAETGDTLCEPGRPLVLLPWELPAPLLPIAVAAGSREDEDRLAKALSRLSASDPAVRIDRNADTGQLVLWCLGDAHADVVLSRLRDAGAMLAVEPVRIALRATFAAAGDGRGRHIKQSGGHGQYAVCAITVEPTPRGSGVTFVDKVVGGAIPRQFIASVEKGVRAQLAHGMADGIPLDDVQVTLTDGKAHSVDSSDAAFQAAGALAVTAAAAAARLQILEPIDEVEIRVGEHHIGAVLSDLSTRRARVTGTELIESNRPGARNVIHAEIPAIELVRYSTTLRGLTGGAGTFTRAYRRHDPAPAGIEAGEGR